MIRAWAPMEVRLSFITMDDFYDYLLVIPRLKRDSFRFWKVQQPNPAHQLSYLTRGYASNSCDISTLIQRNHVRASSMLLYLS
jgi:hypothetical protein